MKTGVFLVSAMLAVSLVGSPARAGHEDHGHMPARQDAGGQGTCDIAVDISDEAERRPGGALYRGSGGHHHGEHEAASAVAAHDMDPDMAGAHLDHAARHSGAFYMAPDKVHHLELVYSKACGVQLYFYNAFTEPIHVERFQAIVRLVPGDDVDAFEAIRFLAPAAGWSVLTSPANVDFDPPFTIELMVKFPAAEEPELFTIQVPATAP